MVRIAGAIVVGDMASIAVGWRSLVAVGMAVHAIGVQVPSGQWPEGIVVNAVALARRVAGKAGLAVVLVPVHPVVLVVRFWVHVAGRAGELSEIVRIVVAVCTCVPLAVVGAGVNREILSVVVEIRWYPSCFRVASRAVCREACLLVVWIGSAVVIGCMASKTGVGRIVIVSVVAGCTIVLNAGMSAI